MRFSFRRQARSCDAAKLNELQASEPERIDIVIPHVDGSAPGYEALCRQISGEFIPCQLRDLGELRFVLRSIDKYASWANIVLVVQSDDHIPAWLNRHFVRIVYHSDFIPNELLPTFHWATIAAHLHRIPGLSEKYVYWEDDVLVGATLRPNDLFGPDGLLALDWTAIPIKYGLAGLLGTYQLNLEETRRALCRVLDSRVSAYLYPHAPLPGTRQSWADLYHAAIGDPSFQSTVTRRSRGDERALPTVDPTVMYANWVEAKIRGRMNSVQLCLAISGAIAKKLAGAVGINIGKRLECVKYAVVNDQTRMRRHMEKLRRAGTRPTDAKKIVFFNVNDEAYDWWRHDVQGADTSDLHPGSARLLCETLSELFDRRSRFEVDE